MKPQTRTLAAVGFFLTVLTALVIGALSLSSRAEDTTTEPPPVPTVIKMYDIGFLITPIPDFITAGPAPVLEPAAATQPSAGPGDATGMFGGGGTITISGASSGPTMMELLDSLQNLLKTTAGQPDDWNPGGTCTMQEHQGVLVVRAPQKIQDEIAHFLDQLGGPRRKTISYEVCLLRMKKTVLSQMITQQGKGTLTLDAKAAGDVLAGAATGKDGIRNLGTLRLAGFNRQTISADSSRAWLVGNTPVAATPTAAFDPALNPGIVNVGAHLSVLSAIEPDGGHVLTTVQLDWAPSGPLDPATRNAPPADQAQDAQTMSFKTAVRIPTGGAVILSSSTSVSAARLPAPVAPAAPPDNGDLDEYVVILRATVGQ